VSTSPVRFIGFAKNSAPGANKAWVCVYRSGIPHRILATVAVMPVAGVTAPYRRGQCILRNVVNVSGRAQASTPLAVELECYRINALFGRSLCRLNRCCRSAAAPSKNFSDHFRGLSEEYSLAPRDSGEACRDGTLRRNVW
jgi:hypothetical protein